MLRIQTSQSYIANSNLSTDTSNFYWTPTDLINIGRSRSNQFKFIMQICLILKMKMDDLKHTNLPQGFSNLSEIKLVIYRDL